MKNRYIELRTSQGRYSASQSFFIWSCLQSYSGGLDAGRLSRKSESRSHCL
jgi:hypothetical protein